jgi:hypothetical protein
MKRMARLVISFALALIAVPFLPLYIERTMLRSWRVDRLGDQIDWAGSLLLSMTMVELQIHGP